MVPTHNNPEMKKQQMLASFISPRDKNPFTPNNQKRLKLHRKMYSTFNDGPEFGQRHNEPMLEIHNTDKAVMRSQPYTLNKTSNDVSPEPDQFKNHQIEIKYNEFEIRTSFAGSNDVKIKDEITDMSLFQKDTSINIEGHNNSLGLEQNSQQL